MCIVLCLEITNIIGRVFFKCETQSGPRYRLFVSNYKNYTPNHTPECDCVGVVKCKCKCKIKLTSISVTLRWLSVTPLTSRRRCRGRCGGNPEEAFRKE